MANRSCPLCFVRLSHASVLARSDELICPSCHSALELSRHSRVVGALLGMIGAYVAARVVLLSLPTSAWAVAVAVALIAYGMISAAFLYVLSDLTLRPHVLDDAFPQR